MYYWTSSWKYYEKYKFIGGRNIMGKFLAFDVGGTFTKYAWMTEDGEVVEKNKFATYISGPNATVDYFVKSIGDIYRKYKTKDEIIGIAMSLPGQIDVDNGIVYGGGAVNYLDEINLGKLVSKECDGIRVSLENDGKCAALAELWKGNAVGCQNVCVVIIGTGVGGGIIIDRKIHRGNRMLAGEFSYIISTLTREETENIISFEEVGDLVSCLEKFTYTESSQSTSAGLCARFARIKNMKFEDVNGELVYKYAKEGDEDAINLLEDMYFSIARLCINMYVTIDPDVILIGGGISAEPAFFEGVKKYVDRIKKYGKLVRNIKIDVCKNRNDSNLYGAVYNFKQLYNMDF